APRAEGLGHDVARHRAPSPGISRPPSSGSRRRAGRAGSSPGGAHRSQGGTARPVRSDAVRATIAVHGSILVRGLLSSSRAAELHRVAQAALDARDAAVAGRPSDESAVWYSEFGPLRAPLARAMTSE